MGTKDARIHTGRNDRDGRARATDRGTEIIRLADAALQTAQNKIELEHPEKAYELAALRTKLLNLAFWLETQAEARHESVDGLHPRDEG